MYLNNLWRAFLVLMQPKSFLDLLLGIDRFGNALSGGNYRATISGRIGWFAKNKNNKYWLFLQKVVDNTFRPIEGPGHCARAAKVEKGIKYRRGNDVALFLLSSITLTTCLFILMPIVYLMSLVKKEWY